MSPEYVAAFATMLSSVEPTRAFYNERRSGRWDSFPDWIVSLATSIASRFDSRAQRYEGSFSIQDENRQTIAKIIPRANGVFVGIRDGFPVSVPPERWQCSKSPVSMQRIKNVNFSGCLVTTLAEASDFVVQLQGRVEPEALPSEETLSEQESGV
jgi:hypothetical protein